MKYSKTSQWCGRLKCSELGSTCVYEGHEQWYAAKFKVGCVRIRLLCGSEVTGAAVICF
jgi:hypothetical protein